MKEKMPSDFAQQVAVDLDHISQAVRQPRPAKPAAMIISEAVKAGLYGPQHPPNPPIHEEQC